MPSWNRVDVPTPSRSCFLFNIIGEGDTAGTSDEEDVGESQGEVRD